MQFETLLTEEVDSIIILTINRPESLNALNKAVFDDLERFFFRIFAFQA
jgi:enoyl-CoA hydratase/carnithine racemase